MEIWKRSGLLSTPTPHLRYSFSLCMPFCCGLMILFGPHAQIFDDRNVTKVNESRFNTEGCNDTCYQNYAMPGVWLCVPIFWSIWSTLLCNCLDLAYWGVHLGCWNEVGVAVCVPIYCLPYKEILPGFSCHIRFPESSNCDPAAWSGTDWRPSCNHLWSCSKFKPIGHFLFHYPFTVPTIFSSQLYSLLFIVPCTLLIKTAKNTNDVRR